MKTALQLYQDMSRTAREYVPELEFVSDGRDIFDGDGEVVAVAATLRMADLLASMLNEWCEDHQEETVL